MRLFYNLEINGLRYLYYFLWGNNDPYYVRQYKKTFCELEE